MGKVITAAISLLLTACGTTATQHDPDATDFIMVSKGEASLLYRAFVGGVDYCKVTKHGIPHVDFNGTIEYDGDTCRINIVAGKCD